MCKDNIFTKYKNLCVLEAYVDLTFGLNCFFYPSTVPSKPPDNITAYSTSSSSIMITWSPISDEDAMGKLLGYLVQYKEAWTLESYYNTSLQATAVSAVIKGLKVLTLYRIQIAGFTSAGVGVQSRPQYAKTGTI